MADTKTAYFEAYAVGLIHASVCAEGPLEDITARLNREHPTGITSQWEPSKDSTFASGQPNPCQCPDRPEAKHYLFSC